MVKEVHQHAKNINMESECIQKLLKHVEDIEPEVDQVNLLFGTQFYSEVEVYSDTLAWVNLTDARTGISVAGTYVMKELLRLRPALLSGLESLQGPLDDKVDEALAILKEAREREMQNLRRWAREQVSTTLIG